MTDDADHFTLVYLAAYTFEHRDIGLVAKINIIKLDIALYVDLNRVFDIPDI